MLQWNNKYISFFLLIMVLSFSVGCGNSSGPSVDNSNGDSKQGGGGKDTSKKMLKSIDFNSKIESNNKITFGSVVLGSEVDKDLPVTKMATIYLDKKSLRIKNGLGVRSFEVSLQVKGDKVSSIVVSIDKFIKMYTTNSSGVLATLDWDGNLKVQILSVLLTDAAGNTIPALIE